jgi:NAD(P)-dependent dehydrogenase (short-subunit alcohol dehydrogenase family)
MSTDKVALVTGYTGESGKALVKELIKNEHFKKIILVGRRKVDYTDDEYHEKTVGNCLNDLFI